MFFDRFDVVSAWYLYAMLHHSGQFSNLYVVLSIITGKLRFRAHNLCCPDDLSENARAIYDKLVNGHTSIRIREA